MLPPSETTRKRHGPPKIIPPASERWIAAGEVGSAEQLMALAHALEHEAGRRYRELATRMRARNEEALAQLFAFLANIEDKHAAEVDARAEALIGHPPDPTAVQWELPENFDEEDARSADLSPYRALAIAVRNEERAFAFYSYVAAHATTPDLRRTAERFAMDELEHASLLRRERRKAWRTQAAPLARPEPLPKTVEALLVEAASMERATATAHRALAARLRRTGTVEAADLFESAGEDEATLAHTLIARLPHGAAILERRLRAESVRDGLMLLEHAFEFYTQIAERAEEETVLLEAQALAEHALRRLGYLHGALNAAPLE